MLWELPEYHKFKLFGRNGVRVLGAPLLFFFWVNFKMLVDERMGQLCRKELYLQHAAFSWGEFEGLFG